VYQFERGGLESGLRRVGTLIFTYVTEPREWVQLTAGVLALWLVYRWRRQ